MQPLNPLRGYSDFFKSRFPAFPKRKATSSGNTKRLPRPVSMIVQNIHRVKAQRRRKFPVFTKRGRGQSSPSHNSDAILNTSSLTTKATSSDNTKPRPRPVSMIVQNIHHVKAQRRRTWFDQLLTTHPLNETSTTSSRSSICSVDSRDSLPGVLITPPGGSYTIPALNESSNEIFCQSIDPFSSSPDAKSTFMDFLQDHDCALGIPKPDFFTVSFNRSSSIAIRRKPPVSIRSIPIPS